MTWITGNIERFLLPGDTEPSKPLPLAGSHPSPVVRFVAENGALFPSAVLGPRTGSPGACMLNAQKQARAGLGRYVEGWAEQADTWGRCCWLRHAWVERDGVAVEVTWSATGSAYFGVVFEKNFSGRPSRKWLIEDQLMNEGAVL